MLLAFIFGFSVGGIVFTLIWWRVGRGVRRLYASSLKAHAQSLIDTELLHRQWATSLKKYGITLTHNGKDIEPIPDEQKPEEWPEEII